MGVHDRLNGQVSCCSHSSEDELFPASYLFFDPPLQNAPVQVSEWDRLACEHHLRVLRGEQM